MPRPLALPAVRSLWHRAPQAEVAPPPLEPVHADVAVVGAGIAGLTAAVTLAREGVEVVVLEARTLGEGTTGMSSAKVTALHGTTYRSIRRRWDAAVASAYAAANLEGLAWLRGFATDPGIVAAVGPVWEDDVATTFAIDPHERAMVEEEAEAAGAAGLPVRLVHELAVPFVHHGAVVLEGQGRIDPRRHLLALAAAFADAGGRRHERTRVRGLHRHGAGHRVETEHADVFASDVLVTTGLPIVDRSLAFARTTCERSYVVAVRCDQPVQGMHLSAGEQPVSLRRAVDPSSGELLQLVGGEGHVTGREADTPGCYERLAAWAHEHLGATEVVARWSAQDRKSTDHLPHVGRVELGSASVRVATAFGKWGMTNGTVAGTTLAQQVLGRSSPWSELVDPRRLGPAPALVSVGRANAEVAGRVVGHWAAGAARGESSLEEGDGRVHRRGLGLVAESLVDGERRCLGAVCPHLGGVVRWNAAERSWDCPLHASRFAADGQVLDGPAVRSLATVGDDEEGDDREADLEGGWSPSEMRADEITIHAPIESVYAVIVDPWTYPAWLRGARRIRRVEPEWPTPGAAFHHEVGVAPLVLHDATVVREVAAPTLLDLKAKARPGGVAHVRFELEALTPEQTRVVLREQPESGPGRLLWSLGGRVWMGPLLTVRNESSLSQLKQLVEGEGAHAG